MSSERPYHGHSRRFFDQYRAADFEQAHRDWLPLMQDQHGLALDVSAGSGRDALAGRSWLAGRGGGASRQSALNSRNGYPREPVRFSLLGH